jgi:hypothetical protein
MLLRRFLAVSTGMLLAQNAALLSTLGLSNRVHRGPAPRASRAHKVTRSYTPNGERECARRRRQIAAGQIKVMC